VPLYSDSNKIVELNKCLDKTPRLRAEPLLSKSSTKVAETVNPCTGRPWGTTGFTPEQRKAYLEMLLIPVRCSGPLWSVGSSSVHQPRLLPRSRAGKQGEAALWTARQTSPAASEWPLPFKNPFGGPNVISWKVTRKRGRRFLWPMATRGREGQVFDLEGGGYGWGDVNGER